MASWRLSDCISRSESAAITGRCHIILAEFLNRPNCRTGQTSALAKNPKKKRQGEKSPARKFLVWTLEPRLRSCDLRFAGARRRRCYRALRAILPRLGPAVPTPRPIALYRATNIPVVEFRMIVISLSALANKKSPGARAAQVSQHRALVFAAPLRLDCRPITIHSRRPACACPVSFCRFCAKRRRKPKSPRIG